MPVSNKLIIVEGLTGSGKSIMAHFIGRQLGANNIPGRWVHEGDLDHPIPGTDVEPDIATFQATMLEQWKNFVTQAQASDTVTVIEAGFFNNLLETLFIENVPQPEILSYARQLEDLIRPLRPALVYLTQNDVPRALARNFDNRGEGFKQFVVDLVMRTPYAQRHKLIGDAGVVQFWTDFVALTDALYQQFQGDKLRVENSAGEWERYNQQVLSFLSIPWVPTPRLSQNEADLYIGHYQDPSNGRQYRIKYHDEKLFINQLISKAWTRLIPLGDHCFAAEGWHFELSFEPNPADQGNQFRIGGRDVDYLKLVGTIAKENHNPSH